MTTRFARLVAMAALMAPVASAMSQATGAPIVVQAAVGIEPDTVRIGDPFLVQIGIRAPHGSTITFPQAPDSTSAVQGLDPVRVETRPDSASLVQWGYYRVAAWDIGEQSISLGDVIVSLGGRTRRISLAGHKVFVASVLPADTALRVPKPARPLYEFAAPVWWLWAAVAAVALLLLLLWWWWRRRKRERPIAVPDPFVRAEREFARLERLGLIDAGERGRYVALAVEVLRDYLAARYKKAQLSLTSTELSAVMRGDRAVPNDRLTRVLNEADLIKFARRAVTNERARELGREARAIVSQEHAATRPAPATATERAA
ncbi:MAG TPA: hypothetical protein VGH98_15665 [Gemmatimonadaceae bacterium]|jgi:hypothetical protein